MKKIKMLLLIFALIFVSTLCCGCGSEPKASMNLGCYSYNLNLESTDEKVKIKSTSLWFETKNYPEGNPDGSWNRFHSGSIGDNSYTLNKNKVINCDFEYRGIPTNVGKLYVGVGMFLIPYSTGVEMDFSQYATVYTKIADGGIIKLYEDKQCKKEKVFKKSYSGEINGRQLNMSINFTVTFNYSRPL